MRLFDRRPPEAKFWDWFARNAVALASGPAADPRLLHELTRRLEAVHPDLSWEAGPQADGTIEFAVSADGVKAIAPHVRRLVGAAPPLPGWSFRAFRQPSDQVFEIEIHGRRLALDDLAFIAHGRRPDGLLDLTVLIRGLSGGPHDQLVGAAFVLLDNLLGEERVMFGIGGLDFVPLAEGDGTERPIAELRNLIQ